MNDTKDKTDPRRRDVLRAFVGTGAIALTGGGLLSASRQALAAETPKRGGSIRVAYDVGAIPDTLDPATGSTGSDYIRFFMFYSGLTQLDESLVPRMNLAESVTSGDAKTWIVKLRKGVTFHDGKSLAPADVVYSLMRHKDLKTASKVRTLVEPFAEIKASGPSEVTITLDTPNADLPVILATPQLVIVQDGTTNFAAAIGTGPYKLKRFSPGVSTVAVRNDSYFKAGQPYLDQIELVNISDGAARINALLSGDVHLINSVDPRATQRITATPGYAVRETKSGLYNDLIMRRDNSITGNPDFVLGMKYLFDRAQIRAAVFRNFAVVANDQPIPPGHRYFNASLPIRPYDPDKARFHLRKAGAIGIPIPPVYVMSESYSAVETAALMQQTAIKAGLDFKVNRVPAGGYWSNHWMKHPLTFGSIIPRPSADVLFTQFFKSNAPWNESGWNNPRFDQLLVSARAETDEAKRKQMYGEMQALIADFGGVGIPSFISLLDANDKRLKGIGSIPTGAMMGFSFAEYAWWSA